MITKLQNKEFIQAVIIRALHTICQTAVGMIGTAVFIHEVNWLAVLSASALAGIVSILKSLTVGLPEVNIE